MRAEKSKHGLPAVPFNGEKREFRKGRYSWSPNNSGSDTRTEMRPIESALIPVRFHGQALSAGFEIN